VKWTKLCVPKSKGALNISLLCRWWWKLEKEEGLWQTIVRQKYLNGECVSQLGDRSCNSPVWNDLLKVKEVYMKNRLMVLGNGEMIDFWNDAWCGITPLKKVFPELFDLCNEQKILVAEVAKKSWRFSFRRWLDEHLQNQLRRLYDLLSPFSVSVARDTPKWVKGEKGLFSVKTTYNSLCPQGLGTNMNHIWKAKIPLKIKIFMWLVCNNAILTKDNLIKRK